MRAPSTHLFPLISTLLIAACASTPQPAAAPATGNAGRYVASVDKLTGDQIVALQRQGYKLVNSNGETLFCINEAKTGSHLQHDNICLTEREMVTLRERTERNLQNVEMQVPPRSGN
jgi:hypothetical protein